MKWDRWVVLVALLIGAILRFSRLDLRPMHTDEAVHAVKFGALLETGVYRYDKIEYHGPTLNYFTLLSAWYAGEKSFVQITEQTLRLVPALFGFGLILLVLVLRGAGSVAAPAAAFLVASSPAMTFYSRYYIQETLLVFFSMGVIAAGYRFLVTGRTVWAAAAGISAGLMVATKETWVISSGLMGGAALGVLLLGRRGGAGVHPVNLRGVGAGVAAGVVVSILLYSSFFAHWEGVRDSLLAFQTYFARAGEESRHGHPWYYFVRMLVWWREGEGPVWTDAGAVLFAAVGIISSFFRNDTASGPERGLRLFLGIYGCLMVLAASAIPYKTPWLILGALPPLCLMAGWGVSVFLGWIPDRLRVAGAVLLLCGGGFLVWQSYLTSFRHYDDPANPFVYAHPTDDVRRIAEVLEQVVRAGPDDLPVQVVVPGNEYWPLPWYLRRLKRVGWWEGVSKDFVLTPVILISPESEADLIGLLYGAAAPGKRPLYVPLFDRPMFLRPGKEIRGYITLDVWNSLQRDQG
jgi:uncharacterized protein (TIGR03663 family)